MKYMGSKRSMLLNGLGQLLVEQTSTAARFVDLFTGSGVVAWFVAENTKTPVLAVDLQRYATILANSVIGRVNEIDISNLEKNWIAKSIESRKLSPYWKDACKLRDIHIGKAVHLSRELCKSPNINGPIWNAYGGHYFSPEQALTFDYLLENLPSNDQEKIVCLAACISAAISCVAAPGHTAQPFQPTESALPFIYEAWRRDPIKYTLRTLENICPRHAQKNGEVMTNDALLVAKTLNEQDLVFIDPPYSSVQYSRFYHVLETIAIGNIQSEVTGIGRYPAMKYRPQSKFSNISQSKEALDTLIETLSSLGCSVIFTFPLGMASNGLSGDYVKNSASKWYYIQDYTTIEGKFSTLGGNNLKRDARAYSKEIILYMKPK